MKKLIILPLLLCPACETVKAVLGVPAAVVDDVGSGIHAVVPKDETDDQAKAIGEAAGDAAGVITGNPLIDMGVTLVVGAAAGLFLRKKKKPTKK